MGQFLRRGSQNLLAWGYRERADAALDELRLLSERTRDADVTARWLSSGPIWPLLLDGNLEGALEAYDDFTARVRDLGMAGRLWIDQMERALHYLGRSDEALAAYLAATRSGRLGERMRDALALARANRREEAAEALQKQVIWLVSAGELEALSSAILLDLLEAAVLLQDGDAAARLVPWLEPIADCSTANSNVNATPGRILGEAAALLGDCGAARSYFGRALLAAEKIRLRPEIALTRLNFGELLLDHFPDERTDALNHLDFAIKEFEAMKMAPSLETALALRERVQA